MALAAYRGLLRSARLAFEGKQDISSKGAQFLCVNISQKVTLSDSQQLRLKPVRNLTKADIYNRVETRPLR